MEWVKKHVDTVIVLGGILSSVLWMNSKFAELEKELNSLKTDFAVMKTVLIMKNIYPTELANNPESKE